jgi:cytochrome c556
MGPDSHSAQKVYPAPFALQKGEEMRVFPVFVVIVVLLFFANRAAAQQPSGSKPAASVLGLMKSVIIPASDIIFGVGKEAPKNDKDWTAVQDSAAKLNDAAKLLMRQPPSTNDANWVNYSRAMSDAAEATGKAAKAKNVDAVLDAGDVLYGTCASCHKRYMK